MKIPLAILATLVALVVASVVLLQIPAVQKVLCDKALESISEKTGLDLKVGDIHLALIDKVILDDVSVMNGGDTLVACNRAMLSISPLSLLKGDINVNRLILDSGAIYPSNFPANDNPESDTPFSLPEIDVHVDRLILNDFKVVNYDAGASHVDRNISPRMIDFNDLLVTGMKVDIRDVKYDGKSASLKVKKIALREEGSGAQLKNLSFDAGYDSTGIHITKLNYDDTFSIFNIPKAEISFKDFSDFNEFFDKVALDATVKESTLDLRSIQHFADSISYLELKLILDGRVSGTVSNLTTESFHVYSGSRESFVDINAHLVGLPDVESTMATIKVNKSYTTMQDVAEIAWQCAPDKKHFNRSSIASLAPGTRFRFTGTLNGLFEDFVAYGKVDSDIGGARVDIVCRDVMNQSYELLGYMDLMDFDLGHLLQNKSIGKATCHASVSGLFPYESDKSEYYIDDFSIPSIEFNGYEYTNISAAGNWKDDEFEGRVVCGDPNLKFMLQGILAPSSASGNSLYHIKLSLGHANLAALNFDKRPVSSARLNAMADFTQTPDGRLMGKINITDIECRSLDGTFNLDDIEVLSFNGDKRYMLGINSNMLKARYRGSAFVTEIIPQLEGLVLLGKLDNLAKRMEQPPVLGSDRYDLNVKAGDLRSLLGFISPGIHIENGTSVVIKSPGDSTGTVSVKSSLLAYNNIFIQDLDGGFNFLQNSSSANITTQLVRVGNITFSEGRIKADCSGNCALTTVDYCNDPDSLDAGHLHAMVAFPNLNEGNQKMLLHLGHSFFRIGGEEWKIDPSSMYFSDKHIAINDFKIYNRDQGIAADGVLSESQDESCDFDIDNLDLSLVNMLMKDPINIRGKLSGEGKISSLFSHPDLIADIAVDSLYLAEQEIGQIALTSKWDDTLHRANLLATNTIQGKQVLSATGYYEPSQSSLYARIKTEKMNVGAIEPFISTLATDVSGTLTSDITISGPLSKLDVNCQGAHIEDFCAKLDYTQVPYRLDGYVDMDSHKITLRDFNIRDMEEGTGRLSGEVTHNHFKDFNLGLNIRANNIMGLNTVLSDNPTFYGKVYGSGRIGITGPLNKIDLNLDIATRKGTVMNIPIGNATNSSTSILTFVDNRPKPRLSSIDSLISLYKVKGQAEELAGSTGINVYARIRANEQADLNIEVDSDRGDALRVKGNGTVDITVIDNNFSIMGDYTVSEGNYRLALLGLVTRDFTLDNGSTIHFTGDIMQSELNMAASYKTKASISPLLADGSSSSSSLRRPVNCGILVTDKLANPNLSFTIDINDLDPTTKAMIDNTLNTEEKRMRQFLALILSGSFIPDEQSGIVNNTSLSYFNATEIMSNQLNSIFQQLNIPIDLGFNYQPNSNGQDIFDVAVSTQLMNNRVSVNGNIGNRRYMTSTREDIVGDVDVEIKLGRTGKTRLKLFSHSADEYSNYLDQTQRNGIGISFKQEFNNFIDLFRRNRTDEKRSAPPTGEVPLDSTARKVD